MELLSVITPFKPILTRPPEFQLKLPPGITAGLVFNSRVEGRAFKLKVPVFVKVPLFLNVLLLLRVPLLLNTPPLLLLTWPLD